MYRILAEGLNIPDLPEFFEVAADAWDFLADQLEGPPEVVQWVRKMAKYSDSCPWDGEGTVPIPGTDRVYVSCMTPEEVGVLSALAWVIGQRKLEA